MDIESLFADIAKKIEVINPSIDDESMLYHYTNSEALLSILKNNEIWLTQKEFMNDIYEKSYANRLLREEYIGIFKEKGEEQFEKYQDRMLPTFNKLYIFSLSLENDLISQWSYYGGTDGYSIAFRAGDLKRFFSGMGYSLTSGPVIYDEALQRSILAKFIKFLKEYEIKKDAVEESQYLSTIERVEHMMHAFYYLMKQPNNYSEKEYRFSLQTNGHLNFRSVKGIITPYAIVKKETSLVPIATITIGPRIVDEAAIDGLQQYLEYLNREIAVNRSVMRTR